MANQTAIALSNLLHTEKLREIYQSNVERYEQESTNLGRELHDSVLQELGKLRKNLDESSLTPDFLASYEKVTDQLREISYNLLPAMLMYGIIPGIKDLAQNLMEANDDAVSIKVNLESESDRLPEAIEKHLFRITQQACENALHHGNPKTISISGRLDSKKIDLTIKDDGTGFNPSLGIGELIQNRHFGLTNMSERASLIGADFNIQSSPNAGTTIRVTWNGN
jgi:signal transduction histidine kinase